MPANTTGFAPLLATTYQKTLLSVGKEKPLLYPRAIRVDDMPVNPWTALKVSGLGAMPGKPEGTQFQNDQPIKGGTVVVTASPFGMLFEVTYEMYRDDLYQIMEDMWAQEGRSARYRQEISSWSIFNLAFTSTSVGYDGVSLCNTAHPALDGTTQSNRPTVDVTLSQSGIQAGQLAFRTQNNDRSLPTLIEPTEVLIHPYNIPLARELLVSSGKPQTVDNDTNALIPDELGWVASRYFVRQNDWFLSSPLNQRDAWLLWRDRPIPRHFDDPFTMNADFTLYERFGTYFGDWRWIYGSTTG